MRYSPTPCLEFIPGLYDGTWKTSPVYTAMFDSSRTASAATWLAVNISENQSQKRCKKAIQMLWLV